MADPQEGCFDAYEEEDIQFCINDEVDSGVSENNVYYAFEKNVKTLTLPPKTGSNEEAGTISEEIVMDIGHGFAKLDCLVDENELTSSLSGNIGNKKTNVNLEVFIPGLRAKVLGFIRKHKNVRLIFIVMLRDGRKFVIGNKISAAYMEEANGTSGRGQDDNNGTTLNISSRSPLLEYTGSIPLKPVKNG